MNAVVNSRSAALFDTNFKLVRYLHKGDVVKRTDNEPMYLGLWVDKQYAEVDHKGHIGYVLNELLEDVK